MITRSAQDTKKSVQVILNNSYDTDFDVLATEVLGYDSSGGNLVRLATDANGNVKIDPTLLDTRYLKLDASNDPVTGTLTIQNSADAIELVVKAKSGQTVNLQEWQNSSNSVIAKVGVNGGIVVTPSVSDTTGLTIDSVNSSATTPQVLFRNYTGNDNGAFFTLGKARGSVASPSDVVNGDTLWTLTTFAYSGGWISTGGNIMSTVDGTFTSGQRPPTRVSLQTNSAGGTVYSGLQVDYDQRVCIARTDLFTASLNINGFRDRVHLLIKGNATQTANLQEWQNSSGTVLGGISGAGNFAIGASPSASYRSYFTKASTDTSGTVFNHRFETTYNPAAGATTTIYDAQFIITPQGSNEITSGTVAGAYYLVQNSNSSATSNHALVGMVASVAQSNATGKVNSLTGANLSASADAAGTIAGSLVGLQGNAFATSSGTISGNGGVHLVGGQFVSRLASTSTNTGMSIVGVNVSSWGNLSTSGGTVTNAYGARVVTPTATGTLTNAYGLYIQDINTAATLNYAIFTNAGLIHFGDTVDLASGKNLTLLAGNITTDTTTGTKIGTSTTQKLGFYNATPVVQPSAYTQTYSTASKTNPTATAANLSTTASTNTTPYGFATSAQADDIATQVNKMQTDYINLQKLVNSLIDDLQSLGLVG